MIPQSSSNLKKEIFIALNIIETFGSFSGLILSRNKTEGMWIGCLKNCKDKVENIKWVTCKMSRNMLWSQ